MLDLQAKKQEFRHLQIWHAHPLSLVLSVNINSLTEMTKISAINLLMGDLTAETHARSGNTAEYKKFFGLAESKLIMFCRRLAVEAFPFYIFIFSFRQEENNLLHGSTATW